MNHPSVNDRSARLEHLTNHPQIEMWAVSALQPAGGRYRTNVWDYAGINATGRDNLGQSRMDQLAMHPTVKPVALIEEALKDCSHRGEIMLDLFGGSGSTLMAAERCGRRARLLEIDPLYCDTIIRRWEVYTGQQALHLAQGLSFEEVALQRAEQADGVGSGTANTQDASALQPSSPDDHGGGC